MMGEQSAVPTTVAGTWHGILVPVYKSGLILPNNFSGCPLGSQLLCGYSGMAFEQRQQSPKVHDACGFE